MSEEFDYFETSPADRYSVGESPDGLVGIRFHQEAFTNPVDRWLVIDDASQVSELVAALQELQQNPTMKDRA